MLQTQGHPKWREVALDMPELGRGWTYYQPMVREMRACIANNNASNSNVPKARPVSSCNQQERILGLCK